MKRKHCFISSGLILFTTLCTVFAITTTKQTETIANKVGDITEPLPVPSAYKSEQNFTDFVQYNAVSDQLTRNFFDQQRALSPVQQTQILDDIQQSVNRFQYQKSGDENFFQRQKDRSLHGFPTLKSDLQPPKPDYNNNNFPISSNSLSSNYPTLTPPPPPPPPHKKTSNLQHEQYREQYTPNFGNKQKDTQNNYIPISNFEQQQQQQSLRGDFKYTTNQQEATQNNQYVNKNFQKSNNNFQQNNNNYGSTFQPNNNNNNNFNQNNLNQFQTDDFPPSTVFTSPQSSDIIYGSANTNTIKQFQTPPKITNPNYQSVITSSNYISSVNTNPTFQNTASTPNYFSTNTNQQQQATNYQTPLNNYQTFGNVYPNKNTFQQQQHTIKHQQQSTTASSFIPPIRDTFSPEDAIKTIPTQYFSTNKYSTKPNIQQEYSLSSPSDLPIKTSPDFDYSSTKYLTSKNNIKISSSPDNIEVSASTPKTSYENFELRGNEISTASPPKVPNYYQKATTPIKMTKNSKIEIIKDQDVELDTTLLEKQIRQQLLNLNDQGESFPPSSFTFNPGNLSTLPSFSFDDGNTISVPTTEEKVEGSKQIKTIIIRQPTTTTTTTTTTTIKPPSKILEEVTRNLIPSGSNFELFKTTQDGNLEIDKTSNLQNGVGSQKKVTFVILEEQPDGTVKVKDVKSNNNENQNDKNNPDVDSILKKIKDGEIKLPKSTNFNKHQTYQSTTTSEKPSYIEYKSYSSPKPTYSSPKPTYSSPSFSSPSSPSNILEFVTKPKNSFIPTPNESPSPDDLKTLYNDVTKDYYNEFHSTKQDDYQKQSSFFLPTPNKNEHDVNYETNFVPTTSSGGNGGLNYFDSNKHNYFQYSPTASSSNPTQGTVGSSISHENNENNKQSSIYEDTNILSYKKTTSPINKYSSSGGGSTPIKSTTYRTPTISTTLLTKPTIFTPFLPTVPSVSQDSYADHTEQISTHTPATRIRLIQTTPISLQDEDEDIQQIKSNEEYGWFKKPPTAKSSASTPINRFTRYPSSSSTTNQNQNIDSNDQYEQQEQQYTPNHYPTHQSIADLDEQYSSSKTSTTSYSDAGQQQSLNAVLKNSGLFAMAKFLRQSGLDQILNETGPYTIFVPTDKAFKALLVQLGGPDKAEEKFKENPRLLSGLLLHHVIPGAFKVSSLQDEMTGVSLAGTQLRINTYTIQDVEWNDLQVLTVNGAKVVEDKKDITIPQGVAHAIDRVMFPLPVGDLLQTLQSDRDGRFSHFLKVLQYSGLVSLFTGIKTYTIFAPVNKGLPESEMNDLLGDNLTAKKFILKHIVPGALYSSGMRYYQVKESMDIGQKLKVYKESGRVKVNSAQVITRNIPATNGVVHAIEIPL